MKTVKSNKILLCVTLLAVTGCFKEHNFVKQVTGDIPSTNGVVVQHAVASGEKLQSTACNMPINAFQELPADVLSGTDVVDFGSFKTTVTFGRSFHAEVGGATVELKIQAENNGYILQRVYKEPELDDSVVAYSNLCIKGAFLYGADVRGVFTENGLLWLELKSKHEFISSDLWIYLEKN